MKEWNGVRCGSGRNGSGFEAGDARGNVFNKIVTFTKAFRCGRFGRASGGGEGIGIGCRLMGVGGGG